MIYNTIKMIGAMATVLSGNVKGILLTGGLMRFDDMGEPEQAVDKALDALKEIYGGKTK